MTVNLSKLSLEKDRTEAKKTISLLKLGPVQARVVGVFDGSGSIIDQYANGRASKLISKIFAVAGEFDDNQELDSYVFSSKFVRLPAITMENFETYVEDEILFKFEGGYRSYRHERSQKLKQLIDQQGGRKGIGSFFGFGKKNEGSDVQKFKDELTRIQNTQVDRSFELFKDNNEVDIMNEIIEQYTKKDPSPLPTYVGFVSDGGVERNNEIKRILRESSNLPIFWQFIGLGKSNYGALRELHQLSGRVVNNANFFECDDIEHISNQELYNRILSGYSKWIQEAKAKNIL